MKLFIFFSLLFVLIPCISGHEQKREELQALINENQQLLDQILRTAQTQYSVGQASQQDILKTSVELAKARSDEAVIRQAQCDFNLSVTL